MQQRVEALFTHDGRSRIVAINQWDGGIAPRFYLGRTAEGNLWRFRNDVPDSLAEELRNLAEREPVAAAVPRMPALNRAYIALLSSHVTIDQVWAGPAYWFSRFVTPSVAPIEITEINADLLNGGFEDWLPDVPHRRPFMAVVEDGQAVSVCGSVRITGAAHEAGVETLPAYRRKGHAFNVVAGWASAVRTNGAIPFYSTAWDNIGSQALAKRLGLAFVGVDCSLT
jgi:hypothetical protein